MNIAIELTGTSPLLMHNPRMVDPDFELNVEIKKLTSKRKKTEADLKAIERLEWYGGLFHEEIGGVETVVQPTSKLRKCLVNTGRNFKIGRQIERAVSFRDLFVPLAHHPPRGSNGQTGKALIDALFGDPSFHSRLSVAVGTKRIMRVRPSFLPWSMTVRGVYIEDIGLTWEDLERVVDLAGTVEGIGDNRVNGYGRFEAALKEGW